MTSEIVLSIITPSFNSGRFIETCLQNVIEQNVAGIEHIIQDGGSSDDTGNIVQKYATKYPHIQFCSEPDSGQSDAMNKGIRKAKGKFITFLNADDYFEPDALQWVLNQLSRLDDLGFLVGNCFVKDLQGNIQTIRKPAECGYPQILEFWRKDVFPPNPSSYFYARKLHDAAGYYDENENFVLDYEMMVRMLKYANVIYVDRNIGNFVLHEDTKTFLNSSGGDRITKQDVFNRYKKELPVVKRFLIEFKFLYYMRLMRSNHPVLFFTMRPLYTMKRLVEKLK